MFDSTIPATNAELTSPMFRGQFNGLFDLIQAIPAGPPGIQGIPGNDGTQGPPFAQAVVDGVTTLNPGDAAAVSVSFDGTNVHFTFGIPRGFTGNDGIQGQPGEVSNSALQSAIGSTSNNSNGVSTLDTPFANDPPTLADMETLRTKLNELVLALRR